MDWGSVAERAQFAIIGATGVAALYVANRQLAAFNRNELVRNTLKVLDDCRQPTTLRDLSISPLNAAARVNQVASDPAERDLFKRLCQARSRGRYDPDMLPRVKWASEIDYSIAITRNFFIDLLDLIQRGLVDKVMILRKLSGIIIKASASMEILNDGSLSLEAASKLAAMARECQLPETDNGATIE
ncbi:MAG: hypothetical protein WA428_12455 [Candidatus Cybelea sp.]